MCEKRIKLVKKGSETIRMREARRLRRLQRLEFRASSDDSNSSPLVVNQNAQKRVILELAIKTIALMRKNRIIKQKIIDLQRETSEFVGTDHNSEVKKKYMDHIRVYTIQQQKLLRDIQNLPLNIEPLI